MRDRPAVLIAGGGVAALETLLALRDRAAGVVEVRLLAPVRDFTYRPLAVLEPFSPGSVPTMPLAEIAAEQDAELIPGALAAVDPDLREVATRGGETLPYDELVVAVGARPEPAVPGAIAFGDPADAAPVGEVVQGVRAGTVRSVALAVPSGVTWTLPLYELALLLAHERDPHGRAPEVMVVTPEHAPLAAFGAEAAAAARELLDAAGVRVSTESEAELFEDGMLWIELEGGAEVDAAIALPRLRGPAIAGLPADADGFVRVDGYGRVVGEDHLYAAGDAVAQPLKQGGLAAQLADVVAAHIAWRLQGGPRPAPFDPVLRGMLLTGAVPRFLRATAMRGGEERDGDQVSAEPLWWPPAKIAARHLGPYLAERLPRQPAA